MATVREIAKISGVSPSTVSRVLSNNGSVREETRLKVLAAVSSLQTTGNYQPKKKVGIIIPSASADNLSSHPAMLSIITSFVSSLTERGISNTTLVFDELSDTGALFSQGCNAFMIIGTSEPQEDHIISVLKNYSVPSLFVNRSLKAPNISTINYDDEEASRQAVNHFLKLGHKKIAFVGGNENFRNTKLRMSGYLAAMNQAGVSVNEDFIMFGNYSEESGYVVGNNLLDLVDRPTAIYVGSDSMAIGCMRCFQDHGLSVPNDIAVIGFGDIAACTYVSPTLSTISQSSRETGIAAANAIQQLMVNPKISHIHMVVKTELVLRESSGGYVCDKHVTYD